jgi:hypothetical protein
MIATLEGFARLHLRRKLAVAGVSVSETDLDRLVMVVREQAPVVGVDGTRAQAPRVGETLNRFSVLFRRTDLTVELNANTGEPMSWICSALAEGDTPLPPAEALQVAEAAAKLPANAVLVQQGYQEVGGKPVFVAHWEHREDGVLVERDYIRVLVGGHSGRVFAVQRRWHDVDLNPSER